MPRLAHPLPPLPRARPALEFDVRTALVRQRQSEFIADADAQRLSAVAGRGGSRPRGLRGRLGRLLVTLGTWLEPGAAPVESRDQSRAEATAGR